MKAMILAAGRGERMRPLTNTIPKPLLKVNGQSLLVHHIKALKKAGINEIIINTWYLGEQIVAALGDGSDFDVQITYSIETELLNTGGGIVKALPLLGMQPFLVLSADILTEFPYGSLTKSSDALAHFVMVDNPDYHSEGDFVLEEKHIKLEGGRKYTYANIGIFTPEFFVNAPLGNFALGDLMRKHIAAGKITGQHYAGVWYNIGTPQDLELANAQMVTNNC